MIKAPEVMPDVLNDLEEDYTPDDEAFANDAQNQKSLKSTVAKVGFFPLLYSQSVLGQPQE